MKKLLLVLGCISSLSMALPTDCDDLDGYYQEETGFFNFEIRHSQIQSTGKVSYNGQTFYYRFERGFHWDRRLQACVTKSFFRVPYYGVFGAVRSCDYPVTAYMRQKITGDDVFVNGTLRPTEIQPGPGCYHLGESESKYTVIRRH